jgi:Flp pilus assembly protein TadB
MSIIPVIGILVAVLIIVLTVEFVPSLSASRASSVLGRLDTASSQEPSGLQRSLQPLEKPVAKWTPAGFARKVEAELYWTQMGGKWGGWTATQLIALRLVAAVAAALGGLIVFDTPMLGAFCAFFGWQLPAMNVSGGARKTQRSFQAQLPEFVQLVSAQMAAGVKLEEALVRSAKATSLVGRWMIQVIQMSQGRSLVPVMQEEARRSLLPELVSMAVQLEFIRRGANQQELMAQLAGAIAADYIGQADQRAEKVGSELVLPMVFFYFLPYLVILLVVVGYPVVVGMF